MGIKDFFHKVGNGIKSAGSWIWDKVKKGVGFAGRIAKPVLGALSILPGKIGMIGKLGSGIADGVSRIVGELPESKAKQKLVVAVDRGKDYWDKGIKNATNITNRASDGVNKITPVINKANEVING